MREIIGKSTAYRAMNIIDAVLCADVIEDAKLDGGLTKIRSKLNKNYGRINKQISSNRNNDDVYAGLENSEQYDDAFYEKLENGEEVDFGEFDEGVGLDDGGLPGIPVFGQ